MTDTPELIAVARAPRRAHQLAVQVGADTVEDLAWSLRRLAEGVERGELTRGCSGGPSCGWTYEYRHDPEMTHERYFAEVDAYLARDTDRNLEGEDPQGLRAAHESGGRQASPETGRINHIAGESA